MSKQKLLERLREQVNFGAGDLSGVPLIQRNELTNLAHGAFDELLEEAKGKPADSPEVRRLRMVARIINGEWGDQNSGAEIFKR